MWHPETENADGCSNSPTYPPEWEGVKGLFHLDFQTCCDFFLPDEDCKKYDHCEDNGAAETTTTTTTSSVATISQQCKSNQWHPDMTNKDGCSNGVDDFPQEWLTSGPQKYFFDSAQECCDFFFAVSDDSCNVYKICEEAPADMTTTSTATAESCVDNKWHPDIEVSSF